MRLIEWEFLLDKVARLSWWTYFKKENHYDKCHLYRTTLIKKFGTNVNMFVWKLSNVFGDKNA